MAADATSVPLALRRRIALLRCPDCHGQIAVSEDVRCSSCSRLFFRTDVTIDMTPADPGAAFDQIATFWGDIYKQWYEQRDAERTSETLQRDLVDLEALFRIRRHMPGLEVPLSGIAGRELLEIGSGAGGHSALFRKHGACVTSLDITPERAIGTGRKLQLLEHVHPGDGFAVRGNAERLPFADDRFDIVYSNGVLHHTPDTRGAVAEVRRVLKPKGRAVLMLYVRHSAQFWLKLFPRGVLSGQAFVKPEHEWLGPITEGLPKFRSQRNPITRVFSGRQVKALLVGFENISLRKFAFSLAHLPLPRAEPLRFELLRRLGYLPHRGGRLLYGSPHIPETGFELALGPWFGFAWAISATKQDHR